MGSCISTGRKSRKSKDSESLGSRFSDSFDPNDISAKQKFPLYSLPQPALRIVLSLILHNRPMDLINLAEISKFSKKMIKSSSMRVDELLEFEFDATRFGGDVHSVQMFSLYFEKHPRSAEFSRIINNVKLENWYSDLNDRRIHCTPISTNDPLPIFNYFHKLLDFRGTQYRLLGQITKFINEAMYKLPRNVTNLIIGEDEDSDFIEKQLDTVLDYCNVEEKLELNGKIRRFHKQVYNINSLHLNDVTKLPLFELLLLNCKELHIECNELSNHSIRILISHWKKSKTRLEYMIIRHFDRDYDADWILEGMNPEPWNPEVRENEYERHQNWKIDCKEYVDIRRDCDQLLASFGYGDRHLEFFVWKDHFPKKPDSISLFSLPKEGLKRVLKAMDLSKVLDISLLSKKSFNIIKDSSVKVKRLCLEANSIAMDQFEYYGRYFWIPYKKDPKQTTESRIINGIRVENWSREDSKIVYRTGGVSDVVGLFGHFMDLFQVEDTEFILNSDELVDEVMSRLPEDVTNVVIENIVDRDLVTDVLSTLHIKKHLTVNGRMTSLPEEIQNVNTLIIGCARGIPPDDIIFLNSKRIEIRSHDLRPTHVEMMIRLWTLNMSQLEVLKIGYKCLFHEFDTREFLEDFNLKPRDFTKRSRYFFPRSGNLVDCRDYLEIERECDKMIAVVGFTKDFFEFYVWKDQKEGDFTPSFSTFPLFSLPILVIQNVIKSLKPIELLDFSLLSKKSKMLVQSCSLKMSILKFGSDSAHLFVFKDGYEYLQMRFSSLFHKSFNRRTINGKEFSQWTTEQYSSKIHCTPNDPEDVFEIFYHFISLFKIESLRYSCNPEYFIDGRMQRLPRNVDRIYLGCGNENDEKDTQEFEENIEKMLEYINVKEGLHIYSPITKISETVRNMDFLELRWAKHIPYKLILSLNCKYLSLWNHKLTNRHFIYLVNQWKKGNTRLEKFDIKLDRSLDYRSIFKGIGGKPWDPKRRDKIYQDGVSNIGYDYSRFVDVERESDGMLASFGFGSPCIEFRVWKTRFFETTPERIEDYSQILDLNF